MTTAVIDRIEKTAALPGAPGRVWGVLTDPKKVGPLFHMDLSAPLFAPGAHIHGVVTHPPYAGATVDLVIDRMVRERTFSWRWHPFAVEKGVDYSGEPMTLVTFEMRPQGKDTRLALVESGFDALPPERREAAFRSNGEGWDEVLRSLAQAVTHR